MLTPLELEPSLKIKNIYIYIFFTYFYMPTIRLRLHNALIYFQKSHTLGQVGSLKMIFYKNKIRFQKVEKKWFYPKLWKMEKMYYLIKILLWIYFSWFFFNWFCNLMCSVIICYQKETFTTNLKIISRKTIKNYLFSLYYNT